MYYYALIIRMSELGFHYYLLKVMPPPHEFIRTAKDYRNNTRQITQLPPPPSLKTLGSLFRNPCFSLVVTLTFEHEPKIFIWVSSPVVLYFKSSTLKAIDYFINYIFITPKRGEKGGSTHFGAGPGTCLDLEFYSSISFNILCRVEQGKFAVCL